MINKEFDSLEAEKSELKSLTERGVKFKLGKKEYILKEFYAGTLDRLSAIFIEMQIDEDLLKENPIGESVRITNKSAKLCAKALAIAILNNRWKLMFLVPFMTRKILWSLTPSKLAHVSVLIMQMSNYGDFMNSIRLIAGIRTTKPNPIEGNKEV